MAKFSMDDYVEVPIVRGRRHNRRVVAQALVDRADYALVSHHEWRLHQGYVLCRSPRCAHRDRVFLHRLLLGLGPDDGARYCDHINRKKLDNRRGNLRVVTRAENNQNQDGRGKTSSYRGVSWVATRSCWTARVTYKSRLIYCGFFDDELAAADAAAAVRRAQMPKAEVV